MPCNAKANRCLEMVSFLRLDSIDRFVDNVHDFILFTNNRLKHEPKGWSFVL